MELNQKFNFLDFRMAQIQTKIQEKKKKTQLSAILIKNQNNQQFEEKLHK